MADPFIWSGRFDGDEAIHRRFFQLMNNEYTSSFKFGLLGFKSDEGIRRNKGRLGAYNAPDIIRSQMASLPIHNEFNISDFGNIECNDGELETAQTELGTKIDELLTKNITPIILGGGHETAFGSFQGIFNHIQRHHPNETIGIINFDAHFDLRKADHNTSGTPFLNAAELAQAHQQPFHYMCLGIAEHGNTKALFETADRLNVTYLLDHALTSDQLSNAMNAIQQFMSNIDHIYITIDLDVFPSYLAPGVSAPAVRGLNLEVFEALFTTILNSDKVRLLDIVECNPQFDIDNRTSKLAAFIVYQFIHHIVSKEPS